MREENIERMSSTLEENIDMHEAMDNCASVDLIELSPLDEDDACDSCGLDANINDARMKDKN